MRPSPETRDLGATLYSWKANIGGIDGSDAKRSTLLETGERQGVRAEIFSLTTPQNNVPVAQRFVTIRRPASIASQVTV